MDTPSWKVTMFIVVLTWLLSTVGSFSLMWLKSGIDQTTQRVEKQRLAFYKLKGLKTLLLQVHMSVNRAQADSRYYIRLAQLNTGPPAERAMDANIDAVKREQDLLFKIAKAHQELGKTLGSIDVLFPRTEELIKRIERVDSFGHIKVAKGELAGKDERASEQWLSEQREIIENLVRENLGKPIDDLLKYLRGELAKQE